MKIVEWRVIQSVALPKQNKKRYSFLQGTLVGKEEGEFAQQTPSRCSLHILEREICLPVGLNIIMNYKNNLGNEPPGLLARQTSIYSLTFDELQNTMGSAGKDFGSMNMDELLKSIWSAEETQTLGSTSGTQQGTGVHAPAGPLQKQGSLTLPRTLSHKTVDEVWRDMSNVNDGGFGGFDLQQRQQTLGEMTLEEFLVKAGVVREDNLLAGKPDNTNNNNTSNINTNDMNGLFGNMLNPVSNNPTFGLGFQQTVNQIPDNNNQFSFQTTNLPIQQPPQQQQNQQILPKRPYTTPMSIPMGITGVQDQGMNGNLIQNNIGLQGRIGGGGGVVTVATAAAASPVISSNEFGKHNGDLSSISPVPYAFSGALRGRKGSGVEKVVERRQRRMIKNRESAARSRARKQAYTMELEAEIAKLKEENEDLQKKQTEITKMQKNQLSEMVNVQKGAKRRSLRRTQTGIW